MTEFNFRHVFKAVRADEEGVVHDLLQAAVRIKADLNQYDEHEHTKFWKRTALSYAVEVPSIPIVTHLLDAKASLETPDKSRQTALHFAAWGDHCDIAKLLVARKADVAATDWSDMTPLHTAAVKNNVAVAEILLVCSG
jgi:ankyrin repeat protein